MWIQIFLFALLMGVAATLTMDYMGKAARKLGMPAGTDPRWIGRWFRGFLHGRLFHDDIRNAPEHAADKRIALVGHYAIGITLAFFYLTVTRAFGVAPDNLVSALSYGFATNIFPWFLMFPAMGFGVCGRKSPEERNLFVASLINHLFYGFGLWWVAVLL